MKDLLIRLWRWRLQTRKDFALLTATFVGLGLINIALIGDFSIGRVLATIAGVTTGGWVMTRLLRPPT
jgi:hypothetical protein